MVAFQYRNQHSSLFLSINVLFSLFLYNILIPALLELKNKDARPKIFRNNSQEEYMHMRPRTLHPWRDNRRKQRNPNQIFGLEKLVNNWSFLASISQFLTSNPSIINFWENKLYVIELIEKNFCRAREIGMQRIEYVA